MIKDYLPGTARVFSNVTPILIFFLFAQLINIEELGLLNYIISLLTIVGIFTDFGLPEAIQRFLPQTKEKAKLITYVVKLEFFIVFIGALIFLLIDILNQNDLSKGYLLILIFTIIFSASNTIILIFNGLEKKFEVSKYFAISGLLFLILTIFFYFVLNFRPVTAFLLARLISWLLFTILPTYDLFKKGFLKKEAFDLKKHVKFNSFATNTFIYLGSLAVITQWDSILITNVDGAYTNGMYKSVVFIATIPIILVTVLHTKLLPFFSKLTSEKKYSEISLELWKNVRGLLLLLFTGYIFSLYIYEFVLNVFLSQEIILQTGFLFPMILLSICIQILITPFIAVIQAMGSEGIITKTYILATIAFVTISLIFYTQYGYIIFPYLLLTLNSLLLLFLGAFAYTKLQRCIITKR
jgi:O-antigen/teichoic acid export membrane protein